MNQAITRRKHSARKTARPKPVATDTVHSGWGLALLGIIVLAYLPSVTARFNFDDEIHIWNNTIARKDGLFLSWFSAAQPNYWPVTWTVFWIQFKLFGMHPEGYHIVNVLLHAGTCLLLWRALDLARVPGAWFAALVFGLHPVHVESVAWACQLKTVLAYLLASASIYCFLRSGDPRTNRWYWMSLLLFLLSMLAKPLMVTMPVIVAAYLWWKERKLTRSAVVSVLPFLLVALALGFVEIWFQTHRSIGDLQTAPTTGFASRLARSGWIFWFYALKALVPYPLVFIYPPLPAASAAGLLSWLPLTTAAAAVALCWWQRSRGGSAVLLGLGYFAITLFPFLGFFDIAFMRYSLVCDHYQYQSLIGIIALITAGTVRLVQAQPETRRTPALVIGVCIALVFWGLGSMRQQVFKSELPLWTDTIARNPDCWLAHNSLALCLKPTDRERARAELEQAIRLRPDYANALQNMANLFAEEKKHAEAVPFYERAIAANPRHARARTALGHSLLALGKKQDALQQFTKAAEAEPGFLPARNGLATALIENGKLDDAIAQFRKALELDPAQNPLRVNIGNLLLEQGKPADAILAYNEALQYEPANSLVLYKLACAERAAKRYPGAADHFRQAAAADPQLAEAYDGLGDALAEQHKPEEAVSAYTQALALRPDWTETKAKIALLRSQRGQN